MPQLDPRVAAAGDRLEVRPSGALSIEETRGLITTAIAEAKRRGTGKLLVVATGVDLPALPTTLDRFDAITDWAREGGGAVKMAIVARAEVMDPSRFDVRLAAALGSELNVFNSESAALAWLDSD
jgi:hypothetical protein